MRQKEKTAIFVNMIRKFNQKQLLFSSLCSKHGVSTKTHSLSLTVSYTGTHTHPYTRTHVHTLIFFFRKKVGGKGQTIHVRQKNIRKKAKWYFLFYPMTNCFLPPAILFLSFIVQPTNFYQKLDKMWPKINKGRGEISQLGNFYLWYAVPCSSCTPTLLVVLAVAGTLLPATAPNRRSPRG